MTSKQVFVSFVLCIGILFTARLSAQDSTNFFPHQVGDMWEYYCIGDLCSDILQVIVISDSTGQDSFKYFQHHRRFINPIRPAPIPWWENFRQDTLKQVFTGLLYFYDRLQYKLEAPIGKLWIVEKFGAGYDIARVKSIYPDTIFGVPTTFKEIWYYSAGDTSDSTVWLWQFTEILADGFGTIFRGGGDLALGYELFIKGAIVGGVVYGDTTLVGINRPSSGISPDQFQLFQNYPNPFNGSTTIRFQLPTRNRVLLTVYNITGKEVVTLINNQNYPPGEHEVAWNGTNQTGKEVSSGIYLYVLQAGAKREVRKMLLVK